MNKIETESEEALRIMVRREMAAIRRADMAERQLDDALAQAKQADAKRQRARQHAIQVVGQCLAGGDCQLAANALFNMIGLLYDEADDTQLYPPAQPAHSGQPGAAGGAVDA